MQSWKGEHRMGDRLTDAMHPHKHDLQAPPQHGKFGSFFIPKAGERPQGQTESLGPRLEGHIGDGESESGPQEVVVDGWCGVAM